MVSRALFGEVELNWAYNLVDDIHFKWYEFHIFISTTVYRGKTHFFGFGFQFQVIRILSLNLFVVSSVRSSFFLQCINPQMQQQLYMKFSHVPTPASQQSSQHIVMNATQVTQFKQQTNKRKSEINNAVEVPRKYKYDETNFANVYTVQAFLHFSNSVAHCNHIWLQKNIGGAK